MDIDRSILLHRMDNDGVATIEIDNSPLNLLDGRLIGDLTVLVDALERDDSTRVVVFRSRNADFFVNHFDLSRSASIAPTPPAPAAGGSLGPISGLYVRISKLPQITIGEIRGRTRGAGSEFALALDMRFASQERAVLGQPEVGVGLHPGAGGTQRLALLLGRARALEVMASGNDYRADVAERYGWVNRALPDSELSAYVDALASRIASFPSNALQNIKRFVNTASLPTEATLIMENQRFLESLQRADVIERIRWIFAQGAQTSSEVELELGSAIARFVRAP